jgi:hypothetical protein
MSTHITEPPSQQQPSDNPSNPKAAAKAAKAYAKAMRPWYKKKRYLISLAAIGLVVIVAVSSSGSTTTTTTATTKTETAASEPANTESAPAQTESAPASTTGTASLPIQNGDWRLDSIRVKDDGLGDFGGTARVTYTGENPEGGSNVFTLTVFKGGKDIAVLNGSADSVQPGRTATVQFISQDKFVGGAYTYDFQNDL